MSLIKKYQIPCPRCKEISEQEIYHSVNTSLAKNAIQKIFNNEINFVKCLKCDNIFQVKTSLFLLDYDKQYCFHYNPNPKDDSKKDEVLTNLKRMFGDNFFLANPIVFVDWEIFKNEIAKMEIIGKEKNKVILPKINGGYSRRDRTIQSKRSWTCSICDGDETTGCLFYDPTECPKFG